MHEPGFQTQVERLLGSRLSTASLLKHEPLLSLLIFALFWSAFVFSSGTLTSGYHLIDDWEMLYISRDVQESGLQSAMAAQVSMDLTIRLRPWYYIHRVLSLWLFGFNTTALSILLLAMAVLGSWFLYLFARHVGFGALSSLLFVLLTFLGSQTAIWWRLGPAESIGIFWFALGLLFMARAADNTSKRRSLRTAVALAGFVLASLTKESFMVLLPMVAIAWVLLHSRNNNARVIDALRACAAPVLILAIVCASEVAVLLLKVGTNTIGYAGVDSESMTVRMLVRTLVALLTSSNGWLIVALLMLLASLLAASLKDGLKLLPELMVVGSLILLSTSSQAMVYAKSGLFERYLIPGTLLMGFLVVYLIARIDRLVKTDRARFVVSMLLFLAVLLSLGRKFEGAWITARSYTDEGKMLHQALEKIGTSTANSDVVLLAADPALDYEPVYATSEYLRTLVDRKNIVIYPIWAKSEESYSEFHRTLGSSFEKGLGNQRYEAMADKSQIKAILTFTFNQTDKSLRENWPEALDSSRFERHEFGQFTVYTASR